MGAAAGRRIGAEQGIAGGLEQRGIGLEGRVEDLVAVLLGEGDDIGKEDDAVSEPAGAERHHQLLALRGCESIVI